MISNNSPIKPADLKRLSKLRSKHKKIPLHHARKEIIEEYGVDQKVKKKASEDSIFYQDMSKHIETRFRRDLYRTTENEVMYDFNRESGFVYPCPTWEEGVTSHCRAHFKQHRVGNYDLLGKFNASLPPLDTSGNELWFELIITNTQLDTESHLYWLSSAKSLDELNELFEKAMIILSMDVAVDNKTLLKKLNVLKFK